MKSLKTKVSSLLLKINIQCKIMISTLFDNLLQGRKQLLKHRIRDIWISNHFLTERTWHSSKMKLFQQCCMSLWFQILSKAVVGGSTQGKACKASTKQKEGREFKADRLGVYRRYENIFYPKKIRLCQEKHRWIINA